MTHQPDSDPSGTQETDSLELNELDYLEMPGLNVMLAHDYYPESHQGGVGIIQNGLRVATNGDLRLEPAPGQWSPVPKVGKRVVNHSTGVISVRMEFPDETKDKKGFNPIDYPDLKFGYTLFVRPDGRNFRIVVHLEEPLPPEWVGKVGFNLELYPGLLFGKTYRLDDSFGIFPRQATGSTSHNELNRGDFAFLASGKCLTVAPESERQRMEITALHGADLQLIDGRLLHNNGWFVVRTLIEAGASENAVDLLVSPNAIPGWKSSPVIQVSQVGYHPAQSKIAIIELDGSDSHFSAVTLIHTDGPTGLKVAAVAEPNFWGHFLRYNYLRFDFSQVREPGMYAVRYGEHQSAFFAIDEDVFARGVWQPTVEYFLPVQMCHMRINENYRVWHGECHMDDARMAPCDFNHIDGYIQGASTLTRFEGNEHIPGLAVGGWHDAGDYDLRVESQADTVHGLALAFEEFGLTYDNTSVDQHKRVVELLRPDGKPDILQQVEHGCLSIVAGYNALGRLYRGIIEPTLRQYTHLGDAATVTDNQVGTGDDRWVFTEENPRRELSVAAGLAAASRALRGFNDDLGSECLRIAVDLYDFAQGAKPLERLEAAVELLQTTGEEAYRRFVVDCIGDICNEVLSYGWLAARAMPLVKDESYSAKLMAPLQRLRAHVDELQKKTPYGLPYEPDIWGAGWGIQRFGVKQYWLHKNCPEVFSSEYMLSAVNFILGCHPGPNTASFVSGVGANSMIPGYGVNRADESYIPGGIGSGTALIRPDFPELLEWPYLWQQTEYCVGYPTSDYVFLIAAADHVLNRLTTQK